MSCVRSWSVSGFVCLYGFSGSKKKKCDFSGLIFIYVFWVRVVAVCLPKKKTEKRGNNYGWIIAQKSINYEASWQFVCCSFRIGRLSGCVILWCCGIQKCCFWF